MNPPTLERTGNTELRQITEEARALVAELHASLPEAQRLSDLSVVIAWKLGDKCIEAKKRVPHGGYGIWLTAVGISQPTASRYVSLREKYSTLNDLETANARRAGYLALLVPSKERPALDGNVSLSKTNRPTCSSWVNPWNKWKTRHGVNPDPEAIRTEAREMFTWLLPFFRDLIDVEVDAVRLN